MSENAFTAMQGEKDKWKKLGRELKERKESVDKKKAEWTKTVDEAEYLLRQRTGSSYFASDYIGERQKAPKKKTAIERLNAERQIVARVHGQGASQLGLAEELLREKLRKQELKDKLSKRLVKIKAQRGTAVKTARSQPPAETRTSAQGKEEEQDV